VRRIEEIERALDDGPAFPDPGAEAGRLLGLAEEALQAWIVGARGEDPTGDAREGFRLLALHQQGARGVPSFNACRETCREIAYHYNLLAAGHAGGDRQRHATMMTLLVRHLALFVGGKLQAEGVGEFCCASRPLRAEGANMASGEREGGDHA
jgi:hypothetical protein